MLGTSYNRQALRRLPSIATTPFHFLQQFHMIHRWRNGLQLGRRKPKSNKLMHRCIDTRVVIKLQVDLKADMLL